MSVVIDYTSKDYYGFKTSMLDHASLVFPAWTSRSEADFGVVLVETFAYMGDILSYYGDRIVNESYLGTATQRASILRLAALLGYTPNGNIPATGTVTFQTDVGQSSSVLIPAGTQVTTDFIDAIDAPLIYETDTDLTLGAFGDSETVSVTQGERVGARTFILHPGTTDQETILVEDLGTSDGTIDQQFVLAQSPVISTSIRVFVDQPDPAIAETVLEYFPFQYIIDANPSDRAFTVNTNENRIVTVQLGDGVNGDIPSSGLKVYAAYRIGGGLAGNIASGKIVDIVSAISGVSIITSSEMTGGVDEEDNEQIRANAPRAYQTQNRAVTEADFENLALGVTAVSKVRAVANSYSSISLYIVGPGGTVASQALRDAVTAYLDTRKLAGTTLMVQNATLVPVNIGSALNPVSIGVLPAYSRANVKSAVTQALRNQLSLANVDFGTRVSLSSLYQTIASVPGVSYATISMIARADSAQVGTADIFFRDWEIATPGEIVITTIGGVG